MLPTSRQTNMLKLLATPFSIQYGKGREILFWMAAHPDCFLNAELDTLGEGDFRI